MRCRVELENSFRFHPTPTTRSPPCSLPESFPGSHLGNVLPRLPPLVIHWTPILRIRSSLLHTAFKLPQDLCIRFVESPKVEKIRSSDVYPTILYGHRPPPAASTFTASAPRKAYLQHRRRRRVLRVPNTPLRPPLYRTSFPSDAKGRAHFSRLARFLRTLGKQKTGEWKGEPTSSFGYAISGPGRSRSVRRAMQEMVSPHDLLCRATS